MIKLIASDIDGTLLMKNDITLHEDFFHVIEELTKKGILFVAASGRPYYDMKQFFKPVADKMAFIGSDGALVMYKGEVLYRNRISIELGTDFMKNIYHCSPCEVVLYGSHMAYISPKDPSFDCYIREVNLNHVQEIGSKEEVIDDILKIGIYHKDGVADMVGSCLLPWKDKLDMVYQSKNWMEFTVHGVNKGIGMCTLQHEFSITPTECMAFGDNYNDFEMLKSVEYAYAMENAKIEIKEICRYTTKNVLETLKSLFLS